MLEIWNFNQPVPWSSGYDSWPTPRQRWFESIRDQLRPRGAVRSARHPVKVEAAGSNPAGDAWDGSGIGGWGSGSSNVISDPQPLTPNPCCGAVRKLEKRRSSNLRDFVGSNPTCANGEWRVEGREWSVTDTATRVPRQLPFTLLSPPSTSPHTRRLGIGVPKWL